MLRRFAHSNSASSTASSPRNTPRDFSEFGSPTSPKSPLTTTPNGSSSLPTTPRTRISYPISPENTDSLSASRPFDWDAVKLRKPPPYASPLQGARVRALRKSEAGIKGSPKRIVRKRSLMERITSIPSKIMFEIHLFPHNIPLPEPKPSAWIIGGAMHFTHLCVRLLQRRQAAEEDLAWSDLYDESSGASWFHWTTPITVALITSSFFVSFRLFSRIKLYNLHLRKDRVNSPHAAFVSAQLDFSPLEPPPITRRVASWLAYNFSVSWRFLLNFKPPAPRLIDGARTERIQQLSVWTPGELELHLFAVYSPAHAFLWLATTTENWIVMLIIMAIVGIQIQLLTSSYEVLLKDKAIIQSEVMHEYNEKFVNPRVNPIRKDASVMTHEREVVDLFRD